MSGSVPVGSVFITSKVDNAPLGTSGNTVNLLARGAQPPPVGDHFLKIVTVIFT